MQDSKNSVLTSKKHYIVLIAILSLVIIAASYSYYKSQKSSILQKEYSELKTIADMKESQIDLWLKERNNDIKFFTQSPFFRNGLYNWLRDTSNVKLKDNIIEEFGSVRKELGYENIFIALPSGHQLLSAKAGLEFDSLTKQKITEVSIKKEIIHTDLFFSQKENKIYYDIIAPIINNGNKTIAILLFRLDPNDYLYPLIQTWPTTSKSAETVLFRIENDSVVFLNELRHRKSTALRLKIPLTRTEVPAIQAALGHTGLFEGIDYRGVEVLSDIKIIPGTNWIILAKIDKSEFYSNIYITAGVISGFSILLIIICGVGFAYIYRTRQKNIFKELFNKRKELRQQQENFIDQSSISENALRESEERFHSLYENSVIGLYRTTPQGDILLANPTMIRMLGFDNFDELAQRNLEQKGYGYDYPRSKFLSEIEKSDVIIGLESKWTKNDGTSLWVRESAKAIRGADGNILYYDGTVEDITERKFAEEALLESNKRFNKLVSELNDIVWTASSDGLHLIDVNNSFENIYGISVEEFKANPKCWIDMVHPDDRHIAESSGKELLENGKVQVEYRIIKPDGSIVWILDSKAMIYNDKGVPIQMGGIAKDITKRRLALEEIHKREKFLSSLFNAIEEVILTISWPDRKIEHVNNAVVEIFGYLPEEIIGEKIRIFYTNEKEFFYYGEKLTSGIEHDYQTVKAELNLLRKDGTNIWCDVQSTFLKENGIVKQEIVVMRDITERKRMVDDLIVAKEKAEEMNKLKSNFLANMSHELRTPLIGINGFADFLRNDLEDPELKQMAENICISGSRLSETLNLILDLSKLESGKMDFTHKRINLVNQTEELISLFKEAAREKGLYLETSFNQPSIFISTDEQAFRSILNNLINNAIKFTNEGGIVADISLKDNFVEIKVTDSGIGIAKENQDMIFEEFRQVSEGRNRNFEGTGLGLNITKKLVEKFGGKISVESEPGKGSTFIVKLPVTSEEEKIEEKIAVEKAPPTVLTEQKSVKPLALSVDDDPFVYLILEKYLDGLADLEQTKDGEFAVKLCMQKQYDYIFMDINLGRGMNGKQVAQAIRKIKDYESIPIIATTGYAMVGDKEEFLAAGCSHYLAKPFGKQDVLNLLEEIQSGR